MGWLDEISAAGQKLAFGARDVLMTAGKPDGRLIILLSGSVELIAGGRRAGDIGAGGFIGAEGIADGGNSLFTALALSGGQALVVEREKAEALMKGSPEFAAQLASVLASHVRLLAGEAPLRKPQKPPEPVKAEPVKPVKATAEPPPKVAAPPAAKPAAPVEAGKPKKRILPEGHPVYGVTAPERWRKLAISKEFTCPVCDKKFSDLIPSSYKLKTKETRADMRVIYEDFEILWYSVRVCPHCNAAAPSNSFQKLNSRDARFLKARGYFSDFPEFRGWSEPRTVDEVFEAFYLSIHCLALSSGDVQAEAQIWRRLMWLYGDVGDREREALARRFTLEKYAEVFQTKNLAGEEEEQLNVILGDLYRSMGERQNAYRHYMNVIQLGKTGNQLLYRHATDALSDMRSEG